MPAFDVDCDTKTSRTSPAGVGLNASLKLEGAEFDGGVSSIEGLVLGDVRSLKKASVV